MQSHPGSLLCVLCSQGQPVLILFIYSGIICRTSRKEGNDQESIQLPNTFRPRHQRERRTHLKQRHHNQKAKRIVSFPNTCQTATQNKTFTRTYMQRHTTTEIVNHSKSTAHILPTPFAGIKYCKSQRVL